MGESSFRDTQLGRGGTSRTYASPLRYIPPSGKTMVAIASNSSVKKTRPKSIRPLLSPRKQGRNGSVVAATPRQGQLPYISGSVYRGTPINKSPSMTTVPYKPTLGTIGSASREPRFPAMRGNTTTTVKKTRIPSPSRLGVSGSTHVVTLSSPPQLVSPKREQLHTQVPPPLSLSDFEIGKPLGKGKFGRVYCVRHRKTGFICALKAIEKSDIVQHHLQRQLQREVEIQIRLDHPNLTKLYGYFYDDKRIYLAMEYMVNGELFKTLQTRGPIVEPLASYYIYQVAEALEYLHQRNIIHRDIKPENIVVGFNNVVKLADFGWSIVAPKGTRRRTLCGTLDYLPPEIVESKEYDSTVDIWALGVLTYELVVGTPPFEEATMNMTKKRILAGKVLFPADGKSSAEVRDLVRRILVQNPKNRLTLEGIKNHPWMQKNRQYWQIAR